MTACGPLVAAVRAGLAAPPTRTGPAMQAYMKSAMPYYGVPSAPCARSREVLAAHPLPDRERGPRRARAVGRGDPPGGAVRGARARRARRPARWQDPRARLYEELDRRPAPGGTSSTTSPARSAGRSAHRAESRPLSSRGRRTTTCGCAGRRSSARWAPGTPTRPCSPTAIEPNLADREFFIRKAIGWALREYAYTDPEWVAAFVASTGDRMTGLSGARRLKHLPRLLAPPP